MGREETEAASKDKHLYGREREHVNEGHGQEPWESPYILHD